MKPGEGWRRDEQRKPTPWTLFALSYSFRDWSLITGRGATKRKGGGHVKFYSYEKGGGQKKF